jgi:hypothetical protein
MARAAAGEKSVANRIFRNPTATFAVAVFILFLLVGSLLVELTIRRCDARHGPK